MHFFQQNMPTTKLRFCAKTHAIRDNILIKVLI
jgi:hypothetical protein